MNGRYGHDGGVAASSPTPCGLLARSAPQPAKCSCAMELAMVLPGDGGTSARLTTVIRRIARGSVDWQSTSSPISAPRQALQTAGRERVAADVFGQFPRGNCGSIIGRLCTAAAQTGTPPGPHLGPPWRSPTHSIHVSMPQGGGQMGTGAVQTTPGRDAGRIVGATGRDLLQSARPGGSRQSAGSGCWVLCPPGRPELAIFRLVYCMPLARHSRRFNRPGGARPIEHRDARTFSSSVFSRSR